MNKIWLIECALALMITAAWGSDPQDIPAVVKTCALCHTASGTTPTSAYPNLAGQRTGYIINELVAFKEMKRNDPDAIRFMRPIASQLSDQEMQEVAEYFKNQPSQPGTPEKPEFVAAGKEIYYRGIPSKAVPACSTCHGLDGNGQKAIPRLAAQHAGYAVRQLKWFRSGQRAEAPTMPGVTKQMSDDEIEAVANFIESL